MKNVKFNNANKRFSSNPKNTNYNRNQSKNNFNTKENNRITKKSIQQDNNNNSNNFKNKNDSKIIIKQQRNNNIKGKNPKIKIGKKEVELKDNNNNKDKNNTENKIKKKFSYNLKLSNEELVKIINNKIIPKTSKISKSQTNNNIYKYNNENLTLKFLKEKQKSLHNLINSINSKKNYLKESSLNNLSKKNVIYKNIQKEKMKLLSNSEQTILDKMGLIQSQIDKINNQNYYKIMKKEDEKVEKNMEKEYKSKFRKYKIQNQKMYENNFKNADINLEKKLDSFLLLEKNQEEQQKEELKKKIKRTHSLELKRLEKINSEAKKNQKYINKNNERGDANNYLYFKLEKSFVEKEKEYINNSKTKKILRNVNKDKDKEREREEYLNKKRMEMEENISNLHKMWKERSYKLPKYKSPLFEKALLSEEDCKKNENDKSEIKKLLYLNRENYSKEKIQLPPINYILKKEISQRIQSIKNYRMNRNILDNLKSVKANSINENNRIKFQSCISLSNTHHNQRPKGNDIVINISLKREKAKDFRGPQDFNYLEEIKKERLLKNKRENILFKKKIKTNTQNIDIETEKQKVHLLEQKYDMDKKLLRIKGGYINNLDLGNEINKTLIKTIDNKLDIFENIVEK